jgi:hypothetical protein
MLLEKTHPAGPEEWLCPTCGRRIIMQWPPKYKKMVLVVGDENVIHSGAKGGVEFIHTEALAGTIPDGLKRDGPEVEDDEISEFKDWMDGNEDLWYLRPT